MAPEQIRLPALVVAQGQKRLYSFAVDGKRLASFTTVSRIHRDDDQQLGGYQRPESLAHIASIKRYLESADAVMPNALVVAFDERVSFEATGSEGPVGEIVIPIDADLPDEDKPGWIVDGQQRSAAIREADIEEFPVFVTAFISDSVAEQRSQFILVNSTKPLPKGLIYELLPATPAADLPVALLKRRYPALLLERLNFDEDSPLRMRIRTTTTVGGSIKDNSVLKMLSASIEDGALYRYFDPETGEGETDAMLTVLKNFWGAVASTFKEIWDMPPRRSRLVHGAGIAALGSLMDEISYALGEDSIPSQDEFALELGRIAADCAWTEGSWEFRPGEVCAWNELQNTPGDIVRLNDHLLNLYRAARAQDDLAERRAA